ncbi:unnamed protein product [Thlaspi arvense]|uniref:TF-B3 domain-containing protein n=1 Tax=Thlaspi arvense TaxID=13288 RepID=A0AAU9RY06_THLAR|nr:unnamed protein product [Thlaspi arvense]
MLVQRVPDKFVSKFKDELSVAVALTVPDGHVWRVGLRKAENKIWFQDGWQEFVDRYSIRIGYLLIFRYEGNSAFSVYIFNLTHSEINYHSTGLMDSAHNHFKRARLFEDLEDEDAEVMYPLSVYPSPLPDSSVPANKGYTGSAIQTLFTGPVVKAEETTPTPKVPKKRGRKKKNADPEEINSSAPRDDDPENRSKFYESASARKRTVTAEERERAINAAKTFEPTNPFFRVVLRPSYLYRGCIMYLPSGFAEKYLSGISGFIKVQLAEKQWPVRCLYKAGRAKFSQGWYEFTLENNLGEESDLARMSSVFPGPRFLSLLHQNSKSVIQAKQIHAQLVINGCRDNSLIGKLIGHYCSKQPSPESSKLAHLLVFPRFGHGDKFLFNTLLKCSKPDDSIRIFASWASKSSLLHLNERTFVFLLGACARSASSESALRVGRIVHGMVTGLLEIGSLVHGYIEKLGFTPEVDVFVGTGLVDMYTKCGCLNSASSVFELMEMKNVFTWTSMAMGLALNGRGNETPNLLNRMVASGIKPNEKTFTSLLSAYCHVGHVQEGLELFQSMRTRFGVTPVIQHYGCIVDLLGKAGRLQEAYEFVSAMPIKPDAILLRSLRDACNIYGETVMGEEMGKALLEIEREEKKLSGSECEDYVALSNVLASKGKWVEVEKLRNEMKERRIRTRPGYSFV